MLQPVSLLARRHSRRQLASIAVPHSKSVTPSAILRKVVKVEQTDVLWLPILQSWFTKAEGSFRLHASSGRGEGIRIACYARRATVRQIQLVTIHRRCGKWTPHWVVHRRSSTGAGASQGNSRISRLLRQDKRRAATLR
jgi:hypothetical protein